MGIIRQFQCPSCQKIWRLCIGQGMRHGILGEVIKAFPEDIQREMVREIQGRPLPLFDFRYRAAFCQNCQEIMAIPVLRLTEEDRFYIGRCDNCEGEVTFLDKDSPVRCPVCGEDFLEVEDIGHWD